MLSVGMGLPLFGVWMHRYFHVRRHHRMRTISFMGCHVVWTTYRRSL